MFLNPQFIISNSVSQYSCIKTKRSKGSRHAYPHKSEDGGEPACIQVKILPPNVPIGHTTPLTRVGMPPTAGYDNGYS